MSDFDKDAVSLKILTDWNSREYNCEGQKQASLQVLINTALEEQQNQIAKLEKVGEALQGLVNVKDYKDLHGKDDRYLAARDLAWICARQTLSELTPDSTPPIKEG